MREDFRERLTKKLIIHQKYYIDAPPAKVFRALTAPRELVKWFLKDARIRAAEGSAYTFTWRGGSTHTGVVKKVRKDKVLVLTWPDRLKGKECLTEVAFKLSPAGKGTVLELKHTGFGEGDDWLWLFGAIQSGWAYFLTNMKSVMSQGADLRSPRDSP